VGIDKAVELYKKLQKGEQPKKTLDSKDVNELSKHIEALSYELYN
jgi:hypothetical protein